MIHARSRALSALIVREVDKSATARGTGPPRVVPSTVCIPAEAVAQAWHGPRQARLARLLKSPDIDIAVMTLSVARSVGLICADIDHDDVVDVHVVLCARQRHHAIVTSDPRDIARIDPAVPQILL